MTDRSNRLWKPDEDAVILAHPGLTARQLHALLPDRSQWSCSARRTTLRHRAANVATPPPVAVKVRHEDYAGLSLTARLMGDPPLSRSGLAQKQQGGQQHG